MTGTVYLNGGAVPVGLTATGSSEKITYFITGNTNPNIATGVENGYLWNSAPATHGFKWYQGGTERMRIDGSTGSLTVSGNAGITAVTANVTATIDGTAGTGYGFFFNGANAPTGYTGYSTIYRNASTATAGVIDIFSDVTSIKNNVFRIDSGGTVAASKLLLGGVIGSSFNTATLDVRGGITTTTGITSTAANAAAQLIIGNASAITYANAPAQFYGVPGVRAAIATYHASTIVQNHLEFFTTQQTGLVGSISTNGAATSYNQNSDRRLKSDIQPLANAAQLVRQLRPVDFLFKSEVEMDGADAQRFAGFIADEVQELVPRAVNGDKDGVAADGTPRYQAMDASKLIPWLVAALQDTMAEVAQLKEQIASRA